MLDPEKKRGLLLGLRVVKTGLMHVVQAVKDVEVMIDVFIKSIEDDNAL